MDKGVINLWAFNDALNIFYSFKDMCKIQTNDAGCIISLYD